MFSKNTKLDSTKECYITRILILILNVLLPGFYWNWHVYLCMGFSFVPDATYSQYNVSQAVIDRSKIPCVFCCNQSSGFWGLDFLFLRWNCIWQETWNVFPFKMKLKLKITQLWTSSVCKNKFTQGYFIRWGEMKG